MNKYEITYTIERFGKTRQVTEIFEGKNEQEASWSLRPTEGHTIPTGIKILSIKQI